MFHEYGLWSKQIQIAKKGGGVGRKTLESEVLGSWLDRGLQMGKAWHPLCLSYQEGKEARREPRRPQGPILKEPPHETAIQFIGVA